MICINYRTAVISREGTYKDGGEVEGSNASFKNSLNRADLFFKGFFRRDILKRAILPMAPGVIVSVVNLFQTSFSENIAL